MGSSRFWLKAADEESKSIPHEFPRSHWLKATGQCVLERYLSATMHLLPVARWHPPPDCENTQVLRKAITEDDEACPGKVVMFY